MPRVASRERLTAVATAATEVFGRLGYQRTKTAEVAKAAGMSTGSLFTYVQTKEALFHLAVLHGFGLLGESMPSLPLATPEAGEAFAKVNAGIAVSVSPAAFADEIKAEMVRWEKAKPEVLALPQE